MHNSIMPGQQVRGVEGRGNRTPSGPCQTQGEALRARRARVYPRTVSGVWRSLQLVTDGPHGFPRLSASFLSGGSGRARQAPMVCAATGAAATGRCCEKTQCFSLPPTQQSLQTVVKTLIGGCFQPTRHLQTTTPACKGSQTPFITNAFIHRNLQPFMHLHTATFIHILATAAATHLPAKAEQVCTAETCFQKAAFHPSLLEHRHTLTHILTVYPASFPLKRTDFCHRK